MWERIAVGFPKTRFLAFTRAWRVPALADHIHGLALNKNFTVYASLDDEDNSYNGWLPTAYMGQPTSKGFLQCRNASKGQTCAECKVCFTGKRNVYFPIH